MLYVLFRIGGEKYAIDADRVVEVVPMVRFKEIPRAPEWVRGLFLYRGLAVPAIDLNMMCGFAPAKNALSTRIMMVKYREELLGLIAEGATDTTGRAGNRPQAPGVAVPDAPFLGEVESDGGSIVQHIRIEELLRPEAQAILYPGKCDER